MRVHSNVLGQFGEIWDDVADHRTFTGNIYTQTNAFSTRIANYLSTLENRVRKLENNKTEQPNPELETLKSELAEQQAFINDN